jgi:UPF0176 protein
LPKEQQKELRKGQYNSNAVFKKGRSEKLKFKRNMGIAQELIIKNA